MYEYEEKASRDISKPEQMLDEEMKYLMELRDTINSLRVQLQPFSISYTPVETKKELDATPTPPASIVMSKIRDITNQTRSLIENVNDLSMSLDC